MARASTAPSALWRPARRRLVVARARFDPARPCGGDFLLPERRTSLEVVDDEFAGGERLAAMRAGHSNQHDLVGRTQLADAMHDEGLDDVPARLRLGNDRRERLFGHARIVLE